MSYKFYLTFFFLQSIQSLIIFIFTRHLVVLAFCILVTTLCFVYARAVSKYLYYKTAGEWYKKRGKDITNNPEAFQEDLYYARQGVYAYPVLKRKGIFKWEVTGKRFEAKPTNGLSNLMRKDRETIIQAKMRAPC